MLEALAATGLRSIRYLKEVPGIADIVINDLDKDACRDIQKNLQHNGVHGAQPFWKSQIAPVAVACTSHPETTQAAAAAVSSSSWSSANTSSTTTPQAFISHADACDIMVWCVVCTWRKSACDIWCG